MVRKGSPVRVRKRASLRGGAGRNRHIPTPGALTIPPRMVGNARRRSAAVPLAGAVALAALVVALMGAASADARMAAPRIETLSKRADLVSGTEVLVRVTLSRGAKASRLKLTAGKRNVTRVLKPAGGRTLEGVVHGLPNGRTALIARIRHGSAARLYVTNHPIGGPIFPRPPNQPWTGGHGPQQPPCRPAPAVPVPSPPQGAAGP